MGRTLAAPANPYTAHLPTTPGIICTQFTHWHVAHLIPLLPGLLEVRGDHLRSGGSRHARVTVTPYKKKQIVNTSNTERGVNLPAAVPVLGPDPLRTPGERSHAPPGDEIPPSQSSETSPEMGGLGKTSSYLYAGLVNFFSSSELQVG